MLTLTQSPAIQFSYSHSSVNGFFKQNQSPVYCHLICHKTWFYYHWMSSTLPPSWSFLVFAFLPSCPTAPTKSVVSSGCPIKVTVLTSWEDGGKPDRDGWEWQDKWVGVNCTSYWEGGVEEYLGWTKLHVNVSPAWRTLGSPSLLGTPPSTPPVFFCFSH